MKTTIKLIFVLIIAVFVATAYAAKPEPGKLTITNYRYIGTSTATTLPNIGLNGMNAECRGQFGAEARMCTTKEYFETPDTPLIPHPGAWINPILITSTWNTVDNVPYHTEWTGKPISGNFRANASCDLWQRAEDSRQGMIILHTGPGDAHNIWINSCAYPQYVTCCTPQ